MMVSQKWSCGLCLAAARSVVLVLLSYNGLMYVAVCSRSVRRGRRSTASMTSWRSAGDVDPGARALTTRSCRPAAERSSPSARMSPVLKVRLLARKRLNSTTRARPDPRGPARTLSETRTDPTEFLGDQGRKEVRAGPVGFCRARVVKFS